MGRPDNRPQRIGEQCVDDLTDAVARANPGLLVAIRFWSQRGPRLFHTCSQHLPLLGPRWPHATASSEIAAVHDVPKSHRVKRCVFCARRFSRLEQVLGTRGTRAIRRYMSKDPAWRDACSP